MAESIEVPPMSGRAFEVPRGTVLRITDVDGGQPGDLVAYNLDNLSESFDQACTRVENRAIRLTTGGRLWTSGHPRRPLMTIVEDTAGSHDLLYAACSRYALEERFDVSRDGCEENLAEALRKWEVQNVPNPLNLFFGVDVGSDGSLAISTPTSSAGDYIELRVEVDSLVAVSSCSVPKANGPNSGYTITLIR